MKPMSSKLRHIAMFSGNTILGDGSVIMIIDPNGVAQAIGSTVDVADDRRDDAGRPSDDASEQATSLLVFRAGSPQPKAVPLSLITRLEEIDARKIELSNGRHMVQYRGQLMPLITMNDERERQGRGRAAAAGVLRRRALDGAGGRRDRRHRRGPSRHPGRRATLPACSARPSSRARRPRSSTSATSCRSPSKTGSAARIKPAQRQPALGAAGRRLAVLPQHAVAGAASRGLRRHRRRFGARGAGDAARGPRLRRRDHRYRHARHGRLSVRRSAARRRRAPPNLPIIALSSQISADSVERGRQAGFHDYVAKFDRQGLIAALMEQTDVGHAA